MFCSNCGTSLQMAKIKCPKCASKNIEGIGWKGKTFGIPTGIAVGLLGVGLGAKGATVGASIGSAIFPGIGTTIGAGIGLALAGPMWGYKHGDKFDQDTNGSCCLECRHSWKKTA